MFYQSRKAATEARALIRDLRAQVQTTYMRDGTIPHTVLGLALLMPLLDLLAEAHEREIARWQLRADALETEGEDWPGHYSPHTTVIERGHA